MTDGSLRDRLHRFMDWVGDHFTLIEAGTIALVILVAAVLLLLRY